MIRFSVFYPVTEGATFDHAYYAEKHVPLAVKTWGLGGAQIDKCRARRRRNHACLTMEAMGLPWAPRRRR
jgi:uncharacterized protein (TIGR02118 family)